MRRSLGVVVIGRNEGPRLEVCLDSLPAGARPVVYVDSGSTDDSVERALRRGVDVVRLDPSSPFTAARARNAGLARLLSLAPSLELVQFVDGDCELAPGWGARAVEAMAREPSVAAVCGRLRERNREATIYNLLCDLEWAGPAGEVPACGGVAVMRVAALREAGGFDGTLVAGEEPELCFRLRGGGHRILRIGADMGLHDAAMTRFGQWWKRSMRAGHAYAQVGAKHPSLWRRDRRSIVGWGLVIPVAALAAAAPTDGLALALLLGYPALGLRVFLRRRAGGDSARDAAAYGAFCVLGKFPQLAGMVAYWWRRRRGQRPELIEYK